MARPARRPSSGARRGSGAPVRSRLRVVAGEAGGLRLVAPPGDTTRPTSDRVREAMFNALHSVGAIEDARALDLFAGSGALGIEALSRGARHATFIDRDRAAVGAVEANLRTTGTADRATVVQGDGPGYLAGSPDRFDLILVDPPYDRDDWPELLTAAAHRLDPNGTLVVESDREVMPPEGCTITRVRRYGGTVVTFIRPSAPPPTPGDHT